MLVSSGKTFSDMGTGVWSLEGWLPESCRRTAEPMANGCACYSPPTGTKENTQTQVWLLELWSRTNAFWKAEDPSHMMSDTQVLYKPHSWLLWCHCVDFNFVKMSDFFNFPTVRLNISSFFKISGHSTFDVLTPGFQTFHGVGQNVLIEFFHSFS